MQPSKKVFKALYVPIWTFPNGAAVKNLPASAGVARWMPGLGRSPGGGHGNPLQYSCLGESHGQRSPAGYSPQVHKESDTTDATV